MLVMYVRLLLVCLLACHIVLCNGIAFSFIFPFTEMITLFGVIDMLVHRDYFRTSFISFVPLSFELWGGLRYDVCTV